MDSADPQQTVRRSQTSRLDAQVAAGVTRQVHPRNTCSSEELFEISIQGGPLRTQVRDEFFEVRDEFFVLLLGWFADFVQ